MRLFKCNKGQCAGRIRAEHYPVILKRIKMFNLQGKKIIVVGGSSGIGLAVARMALQLGADVLITGRNKEKALHAAASLGAGATAASLDVTDEKAVAGFFETVQTVDHIYIAAGSTQLGSLTDTALSESMRPFDTKLRGNLSIVKAVVNKMQPGGSVTFTGGISTDRPIAGAWVSGLATAACEQLARVMVMEYPQIRFNAVSPGYTDTPMWDAVLGDQKESILTTVASSLPVKRIATPTQVAAAVIFFMVNEAVTGEVLHVDGGGRLV
jgi:NAD(P)-dependent dehydrogenase (short-subunit alcohol dehydrogenase family)